MSRPKVRWRRFARFALVTASALAALLEGGCRQRQPVASDVVARVGREEVDLRRFEGFLLRQVGEGSGGLDSQVLSSLFDQFLDEELLERLAVQEGVAPPGTSRRRAIDALLVGIEDGPFSEQEVADYYRRHLQEFELPERVVLYHILVAEPALARSARERIVAGASFSQVAEEISQDPSAIHGGFQGEIALEDLPVPFAQRIGELAIGEVSEVVEGGDGFHLFLVEERLPEEVLPLEMVAEEIGQTLRRQRGDARMTALVAQARQRYNVEIYAQNLPFHYRGDYDHETSPPAPRR
jgi:hypothetical protein